MTFPSDLLDRANEVYYDIMQRREEYIRAWIAETGYWPSHIELVQDTIVEEGKVTYRTTVRCKGDR